jgi:hypothetical protein
MDRIENEYLVPLWTGFCPVNLGNPWSLWQFFVASVQSFVDVTGRATAARRL